MDHSDSAVAQRAYAKAKAAKAKIAKAKIRARIQSSEDHRIGNILVKKGAIQSGQILSILARATKDKTRFGVAAVNSGLISQDKLTEAVGDQFGYQLARLGKSRINRQVVAAYHSDHPIVDQIRAIRSELMLQWLGDTNKIGRSLAVVSEQSTQGRSMTVANLGTAFAQAGLETLIIDADLRNPDIHRLFGINNRNGLSSMLADRQRKSSVFRLREVPGLSIMTAGGIPPNPTELLSPTRLNTIFRSCARKYQVILIDTPSLERGPDAELIASQTSGYLTMGVAGQSQFDKLQARSQKLRRLGANLVGSVVVQS